MSFETIDSTKIFINMDGNKFINIYLYKNMENR
jgi:hypothetical protein